MSVQKTAEESIKGVTSLIRAGITAALTKVSVDRADNMVNLIPPREYFTYEQPKGFTLPAIFTMVDRVDFHKDRGANFHAATVQMSVAVLLETMRQDQLTLMAYRYLDAMLEVLDLAQYVDPDPANKVKMTVLVKNAVFTPAYSNAGDNTQGLFRKEVHLACDIEHYSNF